jgi:hypothetical protein
MATKVIKKVKRHSVVKPVKAQNVEKALAEYKRIIDARYRIAKAVYDVQDGLTKEVIDRIRDRLRVATTGVVQINGKPVQLDQDSIDLNLLFIATEILSDLLLNGIQVANFKWHEQYCVECKDKILNVPKSKKKKVRR